MWIYVNVVHTSSSFRPHTYILIPFEDRKPTGLKVDIAQVTPTQPLPTYPVIIAGTAAAGAPAHPGHRLVNRMSQPLQDEENVTENSEGRGQHQSLLKIHDHPVALVLPDLHRLVVHLGRRHPTDIWW